MDAADPPLAVDPLMAIDAGQTGVRVRTTTGDGEPVELDLTGVRTDLPLIPQLAAVVEGVIARCAPPVSRVAVGTTGLTGAEADATALLTRLSHLHVRQVFLAHDSVSSYLGALGDTPGAVVAAGTGSIILALGRDRVARVDGWGHIMGDAGSGFWIGREGLRAALRAHDGRGPDTALLPLVQARWPDVEGAYIRLQSDPDWVRTVASFSRDIAGLAATDAEAARICAAAGRHLAESVLTALTRVGETTTTRQPTSIATLGNVFSSDVVHRAFSDRISRAVPGSALVTAAGTGLDGVRLLSRLGDGHPFRKLISVAFV